MDEHVDSGLQHQTVAHATVSVQIVNGEFIISTSTEFVESLTETERLAVQNVLDEALAEPMSDDVSPFSDGPKPSETSLDDLRESINDDVLRFEQ